MPNLIQFKVPLSTGNHPTSSGKHVPKCIIANIRLTGCIYTASVAPSGYLIIPGLPWLIMLPGVLHTRRSPPELYALSFTLAVADSPTGFVTSFDPAGAEGSQCCTAPLWVRPFLQLFPGTARSAFGKVPAGSESDCEDLEG